MGFIDSGWLSFEADTGTVYVPTGRFRLSPRRALASVGDGEAVLIDLDTEREETVETDAVVLASPPLPRTGLLGDLRELGCEVRVVGDARGPRFLQAAVHEAHHVARRLA